MSYFGVGLVAVGVLVMIVGYVRLGGPPRCSRCGKELPDAGYMAADEDGQWCRTCASRRRFVAWAWERGRPGN